jgi:hypothetical protein
MHKQEGMPLLLVLLHEIQRCGSAMESDVAMEEVDVSAGVCYTSRVAVIGRL